MIMDIEEHYNRYNEIIKKYNLADEEKAETIANFLTSGKGTVTAKKFAELIGMTEEEASIFLSFIQRGVEFKQNNMKAPEEL